MEKNLRIFQEAIELLQSELIHSQSLKYNYNFEKNEEIKQPYNSSTQNKINEKPSQMTYTPNKSKEKCKKQNEPNHSRERKPSEVETKLKKSQNKQVTQAVPKKQPATESTEKAQLRSPNKIFFKPLNLNIPENKKYLEGLFERAKKRTSNLK